MGYANVPLDSRSPFRVLSHSMKQSRMQAMIGLLLTRKHMRVSLPEIQKVAGAQHGAPLKEARDLGYIIDNETKYIDGEVHSWYILRAEPGEQPAPRQQELTLPERHRDLG
jgi:hypothetical protein